ncbi:MAG TPA: CAP domain-containing protein [Acidimicrobiales bacterium]|nr:CAP domain-containing protein [Acidimicrobiales bacterium]
MRDGLPSPLRLLVVLVIALLAPVGAMVATGMTGGAHADKVETASDGGRGGDHGGDGDELALRIDGEWPGRGGRTTVTSPASTTTSSTAPPTTATTAPPATSAPTAPPTTAPPDPPATPAPTTPPPAPAPTEQGQVVDLVNAARAQAGCGALTVDDRLVAAAQGHSDDMAAQGYFSHTSLDGRSFADRVRAAGYPSPGGENIAQGQRGAEAVHDAWMNSQGHRENILNCSFTTIGVGLHAASWTWTQNFGY